ncbi:MAG: hypothetical protein K6F09_01895 [Clostridiales bacterium]|nr:hypothetical protein [Clostridiales bacterium]
MSVVRYSAKKDGEKLLSPHFKVKEFKCKCGCGQIRIDTALIATLEKLFSALDLSKINVISGYRCASHDKAVGGRGAGSHVEGYAADVRCFYKDGSRVPSSVVALTLERLGHKYGIGYRCGGVADRAGNIHIDVKSRKWYGDETKSMTAMACNSFFNYLRPFPVTVIDKTGINVRSAPNSTIIGTYKYGETVQITQTNAANSWGKTKTGWICLRDDLVRFGRR